jgi:hypothetical protein
MCLELGAFEQGAVISEKLEVKAGEVQFHGLFFKPQNGWKRSPYIGRLQDSQLVALIQIYLYLSGKLGYLVTKGVETRMADWVWGLFAFHNFGDRLLTLEIWKKKNIKIVC